MAVLVRDGKLPRPECVVFADTGREDPATMAYHHAHVAPFLPLEVAPHSLAKVDLYGKNGDLLMPAFTETGKLPTFCSTEWKRRVVHRFLRGKGYGPKRPVTMWLGISLDEFSRAHDSPVRWIEHSYPLLDMRLTRADCERIIAEAGLPPAPKSTCTGCPFRSREQWIELRDNRPAAFAEAVALDASIRERHPGTYLHRARLPLAEAVMQPTKDEEAECQTAFCFV